MERAYGAALTMQTQYTYQLGIARYFFILIMLIINDLCESKIKVAHYPPLPVEQPERKAA